MNEATPVTYTAVCERVGRWWEITVPELDEVTQARTLDEVPDTVADLVATITGAHPAVMRVKVEATASRTSARSERLAAHQTGPHSGHAAELSIDDTDALANAAHDAARGQVVYLTDPQGRRIAAIVPASAADGWATAIRAPEEATGQLDVLHPDAAEALQRAGYDPLGQARTAPISTRRRPGRAA
jgi:hypothetical protein